MHMRRTVPLHEIAESEVESCGGKAVTLGRLIRLGARVPPGFGVVAGALEHVLEVNGLVERIAQLSSRLDFEDFAGVESATAQIRGLIENANLPQTLEREIVERYGSLTSNG